MALTDQQIQEIQEEQDHPLVQLYSKEALAELLRKLSFNRNSLDALFGKLIGVISVDIDEWVAEFGGNKQAAANALRTAASKTISEQEFKRFLNSVPANVRAQLQRLHDAVRNNKTQVGEYIRKPMVDFLIRGTEGAAHLTPEKIKDVQDLVADYLTATANKIAGPVIVPQAEVVQVPHAIPSYQLPVYQSVAEENEEIDFEHDDIQVFAPSMSRDELLSDDDQELMRDIYFNNPESTFVYDEILYFMQIQISLGEEVQFELCLLFALSKYDKAQEQEEIASLVQEIDDVYEQQLHEVVSLTNELCDSLSRYGFFAASQLQQPFFGVRCRDEEQQAQSSRTRDFAENFVPIPIPTNS